MLSFVSSAHSVSHLDEGANSHCTLCFHQHQLNKLLPGTSIATVPAGMVHEAPVTESLIWRTAERPAAQARGPPASL
ncbi:ABC-type zinc uptake system zinc chaperone [Shewanella sp.]|uniref:ABC-type zinc uptake system zinc chaperone n=1 Tax=Shewanella sp. TaxID=50422 RepID=UPI003569D29E